MIQIECVNREDALLNLRRDWDELWESSPTRSFFLTHDWICNCWKELQESHELRVFVAREGGKAVLCAPLMKSRRVQTRLPADCLTFIEHPEAQTADILFSTSQHDCQPFVGLLQFLIRERATDWNFILLDKICEDSPTLRLLAEAAKPCMSGYEVKPSHAALFIPLSDDWESYLTSRSARFRKTLRNIINRMERLGILQVKRYTRSGLTKPVVQKIFSISDSSWKLADGVAMTSEKSRMTFFETLLSNQQKDVHVWLLELDGAAIASEIQVVDGTTVYALRSDYDERYADSSPGVYLQVEILKNLFGGAYKQYNLGVGLNPYKTRWSDHRVSLQSFLLYNKTLYSRLLHSVDHCDGKLRQVPALRSLQQFFLGRD